MMLPASGFGGAQTGDVSASGYEAQGWLLNQGRDTLLKARIEATPRLRLDRGVLDQSHGLSAVDALRVFSVKPSPFLEDVPVFLVVVGPYHNH